MQAKVDGLFGATDPIILDQREQIVSFANREALPATYFVRQFAVVGGLLSYGPSITWMYEQAGRYIGQIFKGDTPANMPVLQPTGFELVVNLKTAQTLGLEVPPNLLARADEVIE
jgi:putative ABC transport system substrate-binding protein